MPCYVTGSADGDALLIAQENKKKIGKRLQKSTRLLCKACEIIERVEINDDVELMPPMLKKWWLKHKKQDKKQRNKKG